MIFVPEVYAALSRRHEFLYSIPSEPHTGFKFLVQVHGGRASVVQILAVMNSKTPVTICHYCVNAFCLKLEIDHL